jgi:peroxiredoxin
MSHRNRVMRRFRGPDAAFRFLLVRVALLLSISVPLVACDDSNQDAGRVYGDVAAPDMTLSYLDGSTSQLSDLKGQVVLLNFWATWCPPCLEELPHFEALHLEYRDKGLSVVGVSMDQAGAEYVERFAKEAGINYPVAMGAFEKMEQIWGSVESVPTVRGFGTESPSPASGTVQMMPTTFLIDRAGMIYLKHVGPRDRETLEPDLRMLMGIEATTAQSS